MPLRPGEPAGHHGLTHPLDKDPGEGHRTREAAAADLAPGQQIDFTIDPSSSRKYTFETKGASDTLLVLFELIDGEPRFLAGDDDSGEDRNARIAYKLFQGRRYIVRLRLYYPGQSGKTSLMYS